MPEKDFTFEPVRNSLDTDRKKEVIEILTQSGELGVEEATKRLSELVLIMKDQTNKIAGVSTAVKTFFPPLQNNLYVYQNFITPSFHTTDLIRTMVAKSKRILETRATQDTDKPCVGILATIKKEWVTGQLREPVWADSNLIYMGSTTQGDHLRVGYFKGARI